MPIAVINLIDRDRQWFKSEIGLGVRETPLDPSICAHAILQPGLFVVPDTLLDDRFRDNPLVTGDPHLRFYAGALLESSDGYPLGTLCVLDYRPRTLTPDQYEAIRLLARQVMAQIELRGQIAQVQELNVRLERAMAESHHRIKNNLQTLASLIEVQMPEEAETLPVSAFDRVGRHIRTLAALHDLLTDRQGSHIETLSVRTVLDKILPVLRVATGVQHLTCESVDAPIAARKGSAFAGLVNELVSNAAKHGAGQICINVQAGDGQAVLTVSDDGPGFPPDFDPRRAANTGLELIDSLARWDLRGQVTYANAPDGGACVTVAFPLADVPTASGE